MKFLILNTDYLEFLHWLYTQHPGLEDQPYGEQMRVRMESLFGVADFYSCNLCRLGHAAWDILVNNEYMQGVWAREHGLRLPKDWEWRLQLRRGIVPWIGRVRNQKSLYRILTAQIKHYKPDVLVNLDMYGMPISFLREVKKELRLLIGLAEPPVLLNKQNWGIYDFVLAPSEGMFDYFHGVGIKAELVRFGFEPRALSILSPGSQKTIPVSFIGSIGRHHSRRVELLEKLCTWIGDSVFVWAPSIDGLSPASSIRDRYQGTAWGSELYQTLSNSKVTLNCHIDVAGQFADNIRLFEATGMGTLLITDWKVNLHRMFESEKEVIVYRSSEECVELIKYYVEQDEEREVIARAGQQRTINEHTYYQRMQELVEIVRKYL